MDSPPLGLIQIEPGQRRKASSRKSVRGWGDLPISVLQHIFRFSVIDVLPAPATSDNWRQLGIPGGVNYRLYELSQRAALARLRLVSRTWTEAVDSHDFWQSYMNHLGGAILPPAPVQHSSRAAAKPPSPFTVAAFTTACRCLICHANYAPPVRPAISCRTRYGATSICANHRQNHCVVCLIAGDVDSSQFPFLADTSADVGQQSHGLNHITCRACRILRFEAYVRVEFVGAGVALDHVKAREDSATTYIYRGLGTVHAAARHAVALEWIKPRVQFERIAQAAWSLDQHEVALKASFFEDRACEDKSQRELRKNLEAILWDRPQEAYDDGEDEEDRALERLYQDWEDFLDDRGLRRLEDDYDWDLEDEYDDLMLELRDQMRFMARLLLACVRHYVNARMRAGWWVHPRDEISQVFSELQGSEAPASPSFTPMSAFFAVDPLAVSADQTQSPRLYPIAAEHSLTAEPFGTAFLPSNYLLDIIEREYSRWCLENLDLPLMEVVDFIESLDDEHEVKAELARGMTASRLIGLLRTKEPWVQEGLVTGVEGEVISTDRYVRDVSPLPEGTNILELLRQIPSTSSLKRSPDDDELYDADQAKRRKASHDSSSSLESMSQARSGPSTAPTALTTPDLEDVGVKTEETDTFALVADVPLVPAHGVNIGPMSKRFLIKFWQSSTKRLFECRCKICARRELMEKQRNELEAATRLAQDALQNYDHD